jgi:hypothetical protein
MIREQTWQGADSRARRLDSNPVAGITGARESER